METKEESEEMRGGCSRRRTATRAKKTTWRRKEMQRGRSRRRKATQGKKATPRNRCRREEARQERRSTERAGAMERSRELYRVQEERSLTPKSPTTFLEGRACTRRWQEFKSTGQWFIDSFLTQQPRDQQLVPCEPGGFQRQQTL
ncbi:hypothetical protein NDU88_006187 [Pleurodeles waltl]|uniref:Uncharacterized protein n=1 Tax=Pleurodeles waltl TaxID=8319 RepID=A0AAV7UK93_PLEWA|nr:hypothetical protein NDU88_006187 [Pleurodeles waltl]